MVKKTKIIQFADFSLEDVRSINNELLKDLVTVAKGSRVGFGSPAGKDHVEGGWTRGTDHVKGGWTRGASIEDVLSKVSQPTPEL